MNTKLLHNSFNAGEISPELFSRPDTQQFRFGCAKAKNWLTKPSGAAQLRPGFETIASLGGKSRLVPFKVDGDDYLISVEAGKFRIFRSGLPVSVQGGTDDVFVVGDQVTSGNVDLVNDALYTTRPHNFQDLEEIRVTTVGGTEPGGTSSAFTYEARPQGPYSLQLKAGATDPVDITSYNSGTLFIWRESGLPEDYQLPIALSSIASDYVVDGANNFTRYTLSGAHGWPTGTRFVWVTSGGGVAPPFRLATYGAFWSPSGPIAYDGREHVSYVPASTVLPSTDLGAVLTEELGTSKQSVHGQSPAGSFTATTSAARIYPAGTVLFLRASIGAFSANTFIRAKHDVASATVGPQTADWETVPFPWLEIPNNYTATELFQITYAQTSGRIRFAHRNHPVLELALTNGQWSYREPLDSGTAALAPTATVSRGAQVGILSSTVGTFGTITTRADHGLGAGDLIYVAGSAAVPDGYYVVGNVGPNVINELMTLNGTLATSAAGGGGSFVVVESTADSNHRYIVTAVDANGREFARSDPTASVFNLLSNAEAYNSISWTTTTDAAAYRIYKEVDGTELFGFIAEAGAPPFLDRAIDPDYDKLAPEIDTELQTDYPAAVAFYDQRGVFGGTTGKPQGLWLTSLGRDDELIYRRTQLDTDRIAIEIASREGQSIRHIVPASELLALSNTAEWALITQNTDALTPKSASIRLQTTVGANYVRPLTMNNSVLFVSEGNHIHRLGYQLTENSFGGTDLSLRAAHLFADVQVIDSTSSKQRLPIGWFTDSSGRALGLTYSEEEQVAGWHQHALDNYNVISVAAVREGDEDRLYATIERAGVYTLVRMQSVNINGSMISAHLDVCYNRRTQDETTATLTLTGSSRLGGTVTATASAPSFDFDIIGEVLYIPANGFSVRIKTRVSKTQVIGEVIDTGLGMPSTTTAWGITVTTQRNRVFLGTYEGTVTALLQPLSGLVEVHTLTVSAAGIVRLPFPCRALHLGVLYDNELRTMPVSAQMEAAGMGRVKAISHAYVRTYETAGLQAGPDLNSLTDIYTEDNELHTEERRELVAQSWTRDGQMSFRQNKPLPATVAGVTLDVSFGG